MEIHRRREDAPDSPPHPKRRKNSSPNWQKRDYFLSHLENSEPDPVDVTFPLLPDRSPIELFRMFFDSEIIDTDVYKSDKFVCSSAFGAWLPDRNSRNGDIFGNNFIERLSHFTARTSVLVYGRRCGSSLCIRKNVSEPLQRDKTLSPPSG